MTSNFQSKTANEGADDAQITLLGIAGGGAVNTAICRFTTSSLTPPSTFSGMAPQYFNYIDDDEGSRIQILRPGIFDIEYAIGSDGVADIEFGVYFGGFPPAPGSFVTPFVPNNQSATASFVLKNQSSSQFTTTFDPAAFFLVGGCGFGAEADTVNTNRCLLTVYSNRFRPPLPPPAPQQNQNFVWFTASNNIVAAPGSFTVAATVRVINFLDN
jgi:hypothetical protein